MLKIETLSFDSGRLAFCNALFGVVFGPWDEEVKGRASFILLLDEPAAGMNPAIVEMGISRVPEGRQVFPNLTVKENLLMGAFTRKDKSEINAGLEEIMERFPRLRERARQMAASTAPLDLPEIIGLIYTGKISFMRATG